MATIPCRRIHGEGVQVPADARFPGRPTQRRSCLLRVSLSTWRSRIFSKRLTTATDGSHVSFDPAFYVRPDVGVTLQNGTSGDRITYTVDEDGMDIQVLNSGGTGVARQVEIFARAYGEREA